MLVRALHRKTFSEQAKTSAVKKGGYVEDGT